MNETHQIRIFSIDHYLAAPKIELNDICYSHFRGKDVKQVPILRVFGTNKGEKTCLHVHGVFPYLHIPHNETTNENIQRLCHKIAAGLDKAINIHQGVPESKTIHIHDVVPVSGIPFYGFHKTKHQFLRIRVYNPFNIKRAAQLLCNGAILNTVFQPHDAHVNYELQFMIDYNLHGMKPINISKVKYRQSELHVLEQIPENLILPETISRQSTMLWEIDCSCDDILNVIDITSGKLTTNPGIEAIWEEERQRRRIQKKDSQKLGPQPSQPRLNTTPTVSDLNFRNRLREKIEYILSNPNTQSSFEMNQSVYPAEISDRCDINLSLLSLENSQDKFLDEPVINETLILSLTHVEENESIDHLDKLSKELLKAFGDNDQRIEDDSILSQKICEEDNEETEETDKNQWIDDTIIDEAIANLDLQMDSSSENSTHLNARILQLDGAFDDLNESNTRRKSPRSHNSVKRGTIAEDLKKNKFDYIINKVHTRSFKELKSRITKDKTELKSLQAKETKVVTNEDDVREINNIYYPTFEHGPGTSSALNTPVQLPRKSIESITSVETSPFFFSEKYNNTEFNYIDFYTNLNLFGEPKADTSKKIQSIDFEDTNFLIENSCKTPSFSPLTPLANLELVKNDVIVNKEDIQSLISEMVHAVTPQENNYFIYPHLYTQPRLNKKHNFLVETESGFRRNLEVTERYLIAKRVATYIKQLHPNDKITIPYVCSVNAHYQPVSIDLQISNEFGSVITDQMYSNNLKNILTKNDGSGTIFNCSSQKIQSFIKDDNNKIIYSNGQLGCCPNTLIDLKNLTSKMDKNKVDINKFSFALPIEVNPQKSVSNNTHGSFESGLILNNENSINQLIDKVPEKQKIDSTVKTGFTLKVKPRNEFISSKNKLSLNKSSDLSGMNEKNGSSENHWLNTSMVDDQENVFQSNIKQTNFVKTHKKTQNLTGGSEKSRKSGKSIIMINQSHVNEVIENVILDSTNSDSENKELIVSNSETKSENSKKKEFSSTPEIFTKENTSIESSVKNLTGIKENRLETDKIDFSTQNIRSMPVLEELTNKPPPKESVSESNKFDKTTRQSTSLAESKYLSDSSESPKYIIQKSHQDSKKLNEKTNKKREISPIKVKIVRKHKTNKSQAEDHCIFTDDSDFDLLVANVKKDDGKTMKTIEKEHPKKLVKNPLPGEKKKESFSLPESKHKKEPNRTIDENLFSTPKNQSKLKDNTKVKDLNRISVTKENFIKILELSPVVSQSNISEELQHIPPKKTSTGKRLSQNSSLNEENLKLPSKTPSKTLPIDQKSKRKDKKNEKIDEKSATKTQGDQGFKHLIKEKQNLGTYHKNSGRNEKNKSQTNILEADKKQELPVSYEKNHLPKKDQTCKVIPEEKQDLQTNRKSQRIERKNSQTDPFNVLQEQSGLSTNPSVLNSDENHQFELPENLNHIEEVNEVKKRKRNRKKSQQVPIEKTLSISLSHIEVSSNINLKGQEKDPKGNTLDIASNEKPDLITNITLKNSDDNNKPQLLVKEKLNPDTDPKKRKRTPKKSHLVSIEKTVSISLSEIITNINQNEQQNDKNSKGNTFDVIPPKQSDFNTHTNIPKNSDEDNKPELPEKSNPDAEPVIEQKPELKKRKRNPKNSQLVSSEKNLSLTPPEIESSNLAIQKTPDLSTKANIPIKSDKNQQNSLPEKEKLDIKNDQKPELKNQKRNPRKIVSTEKNTVPSNPDINTDLNDQNPDNPCNSNENQSNTQIVSEEIKVEPSDKNEDATNNIRKSSRIEKRKSQTKFLTDEIIIISDSENDQKKNIETAVTNKRTSRSQSPKKPANSDQSNNGVEQSPEKPASRKKRKNSIEQTISSEENPSCQPAVHDGRSRTRGDNKRISTHLTEKNPSQPSQEKSEISLENNKIDQPPKNQSSIQRKRGRPWPPKIALDDEKILTPVSEPAVNVEDKNLSQSSEKIFNLNEISNNIENETKNNDQKRTPRKLGNLVSKSTEIIGNNDVKSTKDKNANLKICSNDEPNKSPPKKNPRNKLASRKLFTETLGKSENTEVYVNLEKIKSPIKNQELVQESREEVKPIEILIASMETLNNVNEPEANLVHTNMKRKRATKKSTTDSETGVEPLVDTKSGTTKVFVSEDKLKSPTRSSKRNKKIEPQKTVLESTTKLRKSSVTSVESLPENMNEKLENPKVQQASKKIAGKSGNLKSATDEPIIENRSETTKVCLNEGKMKSSTKASKRNKKMEPEERVQESTVEPPKSLVEPLPENMREKLENPKVQQASKKTTGKSGNLKSATDEPIIENKSGTTKVCLNEEKMKASTKANKRNKKIEPQETVQESTVEPLKSLAEPLRENMSEKQENAKVPETTKKTTSKSGNLKSATDEPLIENRSGTTKACLNEEKMTASTRANKRNKKIAPPVESLPDNENLVQENNVKTQATKKVGSKSSLITNSESNKETPTTKSLPLETEKIISTENQSTIDEGDEGNSEVKSEDSSETKDNNETSIRLKLALEKRAEFKRKRLEKLKIKKQIESQRKKYLSNSFMPPNTMPFINPFLPLMGWPNCPQMPIPTNSMNNLNMMPDLSIFNPRFMSSPMFPTNVPTPKFSQKGMKKRKISTSSSEVNKNDESDQSETSRFMCVDGQVEYSDSSDSDSESDILSYKFLCVDGKNDPRVVMNRRKANKVNENLRRKFHIDKDVSVSISDEEHTLCDKFEPKLTPLKAPQPSTPKRTKRRLSPSKKSPSKLSGEYAPLQIITTTSPKRDRSENNLQQKRRRIQFFKKDQNTPLDIGGSVTPLFARPLKENSMIGIISSSQHSLNSTPEQLNNTSNSINSKYNSQHNQINDNSKEDQLTPKPNPEISILPSSTPTLTTEKRKISKKFQKLALNKEKDSDKKASYFLRAKKIDTTKKNENSAKAIAKLKKQLEKHFSRTPPKVSENFKRSVSYKYDLERNFFPIANYSKQDLHLFLPHSPSDHEDTSSDIVEIDNFLDTQCSLNSPPPILNNTQENNYKVENVEINSKTPISSPNKMIDTKENINSENDLDLNNTLAEDTGIHYFEDYTDFHLTNLSNTDSFNSDSQMISKNKTQINDNYKLDDRIDLQLTPLSNSSSTCSIKSVPDILNTVQILSSPESDSEIPLEQRNFSTEKSKLEENHFQLSKLSQDSSISSKFLIRENDFIILSPQLKAPTFNEIFSSLSHFGIPQVRHENPFYSKASDVHSALEIGNKTLKIPSKAVSSLPFYQSRLRYETIDQIRQKKFRQIQASQVTNKNVNFLQYFASNRMVIITPSLLPPSFKDVKMWLKAREYLSKHKTNENLLEKTKKQVQIFIPSSPGMDGDDQDWSDDCLTLSPCTPKNDTPDKDLKKTSHNLRISLTKKFLSDSLESSSVLKALENQEFRDMFESSHESRSNFSCMITGVSPNNTHGFQMPLENLQEAKALHEYNHLTMLILEIHAETRSHFKPNPEFDQILSIFYLVYNDVPDNSSVPKTETGIISIGPRHFLTSSCLNDTVSCTFVENETELFGELIKLVKKWDPDILSGYEIETLSWGYIFQRSFFINMNLSVQLSRVPEARNNTKFDEHGKMTELNLVGRIFLDVWRLMRHEIPLYSYTFENVIFHTLHERLPKHSFQDLHLWYTQNHLRYITIKYYINRINGILKLLDQLDLIGRTCELAKLFGIQFYEVLSRGSQFRVESLMLRLAKPLEFIPVSPSVQQRAHMKAPEFLPLIMEPESKLYTDPVIVLDFQSLYPSIIIGYNYCFSTCLGRVDLLGQEHPFEFGATQLRISPRTIKYLLDNDLLTVSPCGVAFVKPQVREGILPRMLKEILDCRLMVKQSMSENKKDKILQRVLHSRQLGLKLIANVTYGYTAANFSGRMPCIEVGDSVVSKGRETLERAIKLVENNPDWQAKVVYGDTDSLFVLTPGRSRAEAFRIGSEIAKAVTNDNPSPVKLKLEKIYQPCILQTKKRYVGYMYESPDQEVPEYNAKGIETVRRDGCPAVAKILEKTLRVLFETNDMSQVKKYVLRQFSKILSGRTNIHDLIFAKEYRGASGYRPNAMVPALALARRYKIQDSMSEPRRKERVPYIIVNGPPGSTLVKLARGPQELLADQTLRPHAFYYITKAIIPPLNRCLLLCGADVFIWFNEMPRKNTIYFPTIEKNSSPQKKSTISQHFATASCVSCETRTHSSMCLQCKSQPQKTVLILSEKIKKWERSVDSINKICASCCGRFNDTQCISIDCPVLYRRHQILRDVEQVPFVRNIISQMFDY